MEELTQLLLLNEGRGRVLLRMEQAALVLVRALLGGELLWPGEAAQERLGRAQQWCMEEQMRVSTRMPAEIMVEPLVQAPAEPQIDTSRLLHALPPHQATC